MGIERKSIATLFDEFTTNQIRCWFAQEKVMAGGSDAEVAEAARVAQTTNARRNQLMRAIDAYFDDANTPSAKSYDPEKPTAGEMDREKLLIAHLTGLSWNVLHPTDSVFNRQLAQAAHEYLLSLEEDTE